jgi:hypothetical protein
MRKRTLLSAIFFVLLLAPGVGVAQPLVGTGSVNPLGGATPGLANGGFHIHINPADDHFAFESLDRHTYPYEALHGYGHVKSDNLKQVDRFKDIQSPKDRPASRSSYDSFFGVESYNPLNW